MAAVRKPLQGVGNIVRFNWHFYVAVALVLCAEVALRSYLPGLVRWVADGLVFVMLSVTVVSLLVSAYIYDFSSLYSLRWLDDLPEGATVVNIHAGFDESSALLAERFPSANLTVFDFYDPEKHTEVSIRRARRAYPAFPGTEAVSTDHLPAADHSADLVVLMLAAHEIRQKAERILFFKEVNRITKRGGSVIIVEHLRDRANFQAYTIGFLHFLPKLMWETTFAAAGFKLGSERKLTPFISIFKLEPNGTTT